MYRLEFVGKFDAAHKLNLPYNSPCNKLHGHSYHVTIQITTEVLNRLKMVVDFADLKPIISQLDHCLLNNKIPEPTIEVIADWIREQVHVLCPTAQISVTVSEGGNNKVTAYENY